MHESSIVKINLFAHRYFAGKTPRVLEVGCGEDATVRDLCMRSAWQYTGMDIGAGDYVDVVATDPYAWPLVDGSFDLVIAAQVFEHVEFFWRTMEEIARVLTPGGICIITAPSHGTVHRFPVDCWRFYADGMLALAKWVGLAVLEHGVDTPNEHYYDMMWRDAYLVAQKC